MTQTTLHEIKITINGVNDGGANWPGYIRLTRSSAVKVFTSVTGGTEITFNNIDNKFLNSSLPKDLWVEGTNYSTTMADIVYTAEVSVPGPSCPRGAGGGRVGIPVRPFPRGGRDVGG